MLLQLVGAAEDGLQTWARAMEAAAELARRKSRRMDGLVAWDTKTMKTWHSITAAIINNPLGINLLTADDTAKHLLGQSISDICKDFPKELRILHVELGFRDDLVRRFLYRQQEIRDDLSKLSTSDLRKSVWHKDLRSGRILNSHEGLVEGLARPAVTFHGAPRQVVSSIVWYGFIMPGQKIGDTGKQLSIRCGASFGVGIYSSPDPAYASYYSEYGGIGSSGNGGIFYPGDLPGFRLIVCATSDGPTHPCGLGRSPSQRRLA
jgi:hypothetical protein